MRNRVDDFIQPLLGTGISLLLSLYACVDSSLFVFHTFAQFLELPLILFLKLLHLLQALVDCLFLLIDL